MNETHDGDGVMRKLREVFVVLCMRSTLINTKTLKNMMEILMSALVRAGGGGRGGLNYLRVDSLLELRV